jgi:RNA polymerase sigma factor (TIGR02999 family)
MMPDRPQDITLLLRAWSEGGREAFGQLYALVEPELRRLASRQLANEQAQTTLTTTALVNEACLRLFGSKPLAARDRLHFFALCARIMRAILVDHARARRSAKRGGGAHPLPLLDDAIPAPQPASDILAIDEALDSLTRLDPRKGRVVELRFFGGLTVEETAEVLGVSPNTVKRDWRLAKLWLLRELSGGRSPALA